MSIYPPPPLPTGTVTTMSTIPITGNSNLDTPLRLAVTFLVIGLIAMIATARRA